MVKVWRGTLGPPVEVAQATGAYKNAGILVLTRRPKGARKPEEYRVFGPGEWTLAEVYDHGSTVTQIVANS